MKYFYLIVLLVSITLSETAQVTMVTNLPTNLTPNVIVNMEVKINKGAINNFSKYEIDLPEGFDATEDDSKSGYFTLEKKCLKIVWVTLPNENEFVISLKLKTPFFKGKYTLPHKFFYIDNGTKKVVIGNDIHLIIDTLGTTKTLSYLPDQPVNTVNSIIAVNTTTQITLNTIESKSNSTQTIITTNTNTVINSQIIAQNELIYLVQIGSYSSAPETNTFKDLGNVTIEKVGNIFKVLIGNFNTKEDALKKKTDLTSKGYNGFVVTRQKNK